MQFLFSKMCFLYLHLLSVGNIPVNHICLSVLLSKALHNVCSATDFQHCESAGMKSKAAQIREEGCIVVKRLQEKRHSGHEPFPFPPLPFPLHPCYFHFGNVASETWCFFSVAAAWHPHLLHELLVLSVAGNKMFEEAFLWIMLSFGAMHFGERDTWVALLFR